MTLIIRNANKDFAEAVRNMAKDYNSMIEITEQKEPSSEVNSKKFYRLRSLKSIFEYKELENQEIYFASLDELNDPMEGFRNIVFKGDEIVWRNLFKNYLKCLEWVYLIDLMSSGKYNFLEDSIFPLHDYLNNHFTITFSEISKEFMKIFDEIIKKLSARTVTISRNELIFYLDLIHSIAFDIIQKNYRPDISNTANNNKDEVVKLITETIDRIECEGKKVERALLESKMITDSLKLLASKHTKSNRDSKFISFIDFYMKGLEKLMHPEYYIACFMGNANASSVWGHYGDGHKGICLVFETDDDYLLELREKRHSEENTKEKEWHKYNFQQVIYGDSYDEANFFETIQRLSPEQLIVNWYVDVEKKQKSANPILEKILKSKDRKSEQCHDDKKSIFTKSMDWKDENEYRIIIDSYLNDTMDKENRKLEYHFKNLHGIIFGIRTSLQDKIRIINIIEQKCKDEKREDFKFYQAYYCQKDNQIKTSELFIPLNTN